MKVESLHSLMFNPAWTSSLLEYFLSGSKAVAGKGVSLEVIFLVLPFVFNPVLRKTLASKRIDTNLSTVLNDPMVRIEVLKFGKSIDRYRGVTRSAILALGSKAFLVNGRLTVESGVDYKSADINIRPFCKAAYLLGAILCKELDKDVFIKLGAMS
ncbi:hypothetical protein GHU30_29590 [Pseudomonas aeruginosa]|uniref:three component ABC system middle component n=1 Tax=Pseudomonas TaxID=286 RepID=UPI000F52C060|nr:MULTISPECIES: three component ABC system middle component [Pseudomonas]HCL2796716.1 hypothetical protein [Pseudomonas aeruginosa 7D9A]EIU7152484.1 hypothetical protein [Pseudomonas aeruginosa]MBF8667393.1 hypothetical protein [Pseudomonas aeruginosa]MBF8686826.1 hypothetical protein [Pseudomonas aeruginosa]MBG3948294.1 hypothetical protein [Pseudomonas aeruginosa]